MGNTVGRKRSKAPLRSSPTGQSADRPVPASLEEKKESETDAATTTTTRGNDNNRAEASVVKEDETDLNDADIEGEDIEGEDDNKDWNNDTLSKRPALQRKINQDLQWQQDNSPTHDWWNQFGGHDLEPALGSGAIALLDAQWLVNFVYQTQAMGQVAVLPRRQDLPPEAFLSLADVMAATSGNESIQIIALSYMWLHPSHPDPKGTTLKLVAEWCLHKLDYNCQYVEHGSNNTDRYCPRFGIFWDYASLFQHPNPSKGLYRSIEEDDLFRQGLDALGSLFSHPRTHCFKVTQFPTNYPQGYDLPKGSNSAGYYQRGWPSVESLWVSLAKNSALTYDISREDASVAFQKRATTQNRLAPLTPEQLDGKLQHLSFTNAKEDRPLLSRLYKGQFEKRFHDMEEMRFPELGWDDEQIQQLALIIQSGHVPKLTSVNLQCNKFGLAGCSALANALTPPSPRLDVLDLMWCRDIGSSGVEALANVLIGIREVKLGIVNLDASGCRALAQAVDNARRNNQQDCVRLQKLSLFRNADVGDAGVQYLAPLAVRYLQTLELNSCGVGDGACQALAEAVDTLEGQYQCSLMELNLSGNPNITDNGYQHLGRFLSKSPHLKKLYPTRSDALSRNKAMLKSCALNPNVI